MKSKISIMTDIETLGKGLNPCIFQIAATAFNIETGEQIDSINLKMDVKNAGSIAVDGDTLVWWLNTNKELLTQLLNEGNLTEREMIEQLDSWIKSLGAKEDITLWGNGILFDNAKLQAKFSSLGMNYPIHYKNDRDVRTILALAADKTGLSENEIKKAVEDENEVAHDALDDVSYQIRLVCYAYKLLMA